MHEVHYFIFHRIFDVEMFNILRSNRNIFQIFNESQVLNYITNVLTIPAYTAERNSLTKNGFRVHCRLNISKLLQQPHELAKAVNLALKHHFAGSARIHERVLCDLDEDGNIKERDSINLMEATTATQVYESLIEHIKQFYPDWSVENQTKAARMVDTMIMTMDISDIQALVDDPRELAA